MENITLKQMLQAREARVQRQQEILAQAGVPIVSFCLNIAGPVKNSPMLRRVFDEGLVRLENAVAAAELKVVQRESRDADTGCEAIWAVDASPYKLKALCVDIEDMDALGRLFDLDVLDASHGKWERSELGFPPRKCLICGREGKACAARRLHDVAQLQEKTRAIVQEFYARKDRKYLASLGARALLYEVCTTPKPGLVDRHDNGSHKDMDVFKFIDSTAALLPYLEESVKIGQRTGSRPPEATFELLRSAGIVAEQEMFRATGGVNTHKGAIFSMGCLLGACGRLWRPDGFCRDPERLLRECGLMATPSAEQHFATLTLASAHTAGEWQYVQAGLKGIRGEAADGFPAVLHTALPALRAALDTGAGLEQAGTAALLALMANTVDSNLIARGGVYGRRWVAKEAQRLLDKSPCPDAADIAVLNQKLVKKNLSPGGCADLLALTYLLYFLAESA